MQTIILKHVQVFVVITFEIFQIFFLDRGVGGWGQLYRNFFGIFFIFTRSLRHWFDSVKHDLRSASIDTTIADLVVLDHSPHVDQ